MKFSKPSLRPMRWASAYKMTEGRRQRLLHSWLRGEVALDPSSVLGWEWPGSKGRGGGSWRRRRQTPIATRDGGEGVRMGQRVLATFFRA